MYVCKVKVTQSCPTLCDPMNYTFHGILQARILEWVAFPFSEDLPDPRIRLGSPALQADSFPTEPSGKPHVYVCQFLIIQWGVCTHTHTLTYTYISSVQLLSCVRLFWDTIDCSTPGFPVHHQLPELTQTHVHWVSDAIQPSHPLSSPSPAFNLSQHRGLFQWGFCLHQVAKVLEFQLQHVLQMNIQNWSPWGWTGWISLQSKGLSRIFSSTTVQKHQFFGTQLSLQSNYHIRTWLLG